MDLFAFVEACIYYTSIILGIIGGERIGEYWGIFWNNRVICRNN